MRRGLAGEPSSIAMNPAYVQPPAGDERGRFATLDLGGTNVRATVVELPGNGAIRVIRNDTFRLPATAGTADDLFRPIVRFLAGVMADAGPNDGQDCALGFTFAFPMRQTGIRAGVLAKWTKEIRLRWSRGQRRSSTPPSRHRARIRRQPASAPPDRLRP